VHDCVVALAGRVIQARTFQQSPQVIERDPAFELEQGTLDDVLELEAVDGAEPVRESRCPHASVAKRPRSWGPITRKVVCCGERSSMY